MHHIVVISDIHLCQLEPGEGLWMRYRQEECAPDREIAAMLDALLAEVAASQRDGERHAVTLVLNGDIFDFDAPRVEQGRSVVHDDPRDSAHSAPLTEGILDDHPVFVAAVARVLTAGHTVLFISGNHDAQVTLPSVRDVIRRRLLDAAAEQTHEGRDDLSSRILFRAWFHITEERVLLEHGGQYDPYCTFLYPMAPYHRDTGRVQPSLGSVAARLMTSRMGYFNPHVDSTYALSGSAYVAHWLRYYVRSSRSLLFAWLFNAVRTFLHLAFARDKGHERRYRENIEAAARETGASEAALKEHVELFASAVEVSDLRGLARELWVDRTAFLVGSILWAAGWLVFAPRPLAPLALLGVVLFVVYELRVHKVSVQERWEGVDRRAKDVARVHGARAIVFGHTHHPHASWEDGVFVANAGSWSSSYYDVECTVPVFPERPLVWLKASADQIEGGLVAWTGSAFKPLVVRPINDRIDGSSSENPRRARSIAARLEPEARHQALEVPPVDARVARRLGDVAAALREDRLDVSPLKPLDPGVLCLVVREL
jgi:UDP-2,3-diacylglucosamine pyrophosphatase LpxH